MNFANRLDPNHSRTRPKSKLFDIQIVFLEVSFFVSFSFRGKVNFGKDQQTTKTYKITPPAESLLEYSHVIHSTSILKK